MNGLASASVVKPSVDMKRDLGTAGLVIMVLALLGILAHWHQSGKNTRAGSQPELLIVHGRTSEPAAPVGRIADRPAMALPTNAVQRLTGSGQLDSGSYFSCWITNASRWTISELRFRIRAVETHGMVRWERHYRDPVQIQPHRQAFVHFKVSEGGAEATAEWEVVAARGYPPDPQSETAHGL